MRILVVTISDRASKGTYEDRSGPVIERVLTERLEDVEIERAIVSDEPAEIEKALTGAEGYDMIITSGGTGIGPRDNTPDVTASVCDKMIPGISEYLRSESMEDTVNAVFSRGVAGIRGKTIIVNVPGSVKGASFCAILLTGIIPHAIKMVEGEGH